MHESSGDMTCTIATLCGGAVADQIATALGAVAENIADVATEAGAKRTVTVTLEFSPEQDRAMVKVKATVTAKLAPDRPSETRLEILPGRQFVEYVPPQLSLPLAGVVDMRAMRGKDG